MNDKDFLPKVMETWTVTPNNGGESITIIGDMICKDVTIDNISSGYTMYFRTAEGLKKFSAFHYSAKQLEVLGQELPEPPEAPKYPYEIGKTYYCVGPLQKNGIEKWRFSNDKYDLSRLEIGNLFETEEEAIAFKQQLILKKQGVHCGF